METGTCVRPADENPTDPTDCRSGDDSSIRGTVNTTPLADRLALTALATDRFVGHPPDGFDQRVFGGHLLAQALLAAAETVNHSRQANSLHAYFLRAGHAGEPIDYSVTRIRDGRSISVRSVTARQGEKELMTFQTSFTEERPLSDVIATKPPASPHPETVQPLHQRQDDPDSPPDGINWPTRTRWWTGSRPLDVRYIDDTDDASTRRFWFRAEPLGPGASQNLHRAIVAFASDRSLLPVIAKARGDLRRSGEQRVASVDHALWFHRDVRAGQWLQYVQDSPHSASRGLGTARGLIYTSGGDLVVSVVQQGFQQ
ncbi:acyl-CoA thioesterase [Rhodococcus jostii]|uniref:acyl-CoA thioesterase n=1 Tax=Rhodococcus jostii TaxID=132919 RepID=UPI0036321175